MKEALKSLAARSWKKINMLENQNVIALHIRMGDKLAFSNIAQSGDERIPWKELPLFFNAAIKVAENVSNVLYFLATDNMQVIDMAKDYLGKKLITIAGTPSHLDLMPAYNKTGFWKLIMDWLMLAQADVIIHGPYSTFVEKALIYNYFQKKERMIIKCASKEH